MPNRLQAVAVGAAVALATLVPYLLAGWLTGPDELFSGFLLNPLDGFSYLAKMRQGAEGSWGFRLPYAPDPGPAAFFFVFYLALGHLSAWLQTELLVLFHGARVLFAATMFFLAYLLFEHTSASHKAVQAAFALTLVGSGLGWLGLPFGAAPSDLMIPESIPFLSAYVNPHFPAATALQTLGTLLVATEIMGGRWREILCFTSGLVLMLILPFAIVSQIAFLALWLAWEVYYLSRIGFPPLSALERIPWRPFLFLVAGAAPVMAYDLWLTRNHPVLAAWSAQNLTPSPPPHEYLLGYGFVLLFAVFQIVKRKPYQTSLGRLLLAWIVIGFLLLYVPFSLQRRFSLGLFLPLAALAGQWLAEFSPRWLRWRLALLLSLVLTVPSNLFVVAAGLSSLRQSDALVLTRSELTGYSWVSANLPQGALILGAPVTGNRLPAFADVRVVYGHPFETPDADEARNLVVSYLRWGGPASDAIESMARNRIEYVFYGERERRFGNPTWRGRLPAVYERSGLAILRVSSP